MFSFIFRLFVPSYKAKRPKANAKLKVIQNSLPENGSKNCVSTQISFFKETSSKQINVINMIIYLFQSCNIICKKRILFLTEEVWLWYNKLTVVDNRPGPQEARSENPEGGGEVVMWWSPPAPTAFQNIRPAEFFDSI